MHYFEGDLNGQGLRSLKKLKEGSTAGATKIGCILEDGSASGAARRHSRGYISATARAPIQSNINACIGK